MNANKADQYINNPGQRICNTCGTALAEKVLLCPRCHALVYGQLLKDKFQEAKEHEECSDYLSSIALLRECLPLLPTTSNQFQWIASKIDTLGKQLEKNPEIYSKRRAKLTATDESETTHSGVKKERSEKQESNTFISKVVANFKVLFENLSKSTTLITMILAICVYWSAWGWQFALGFVLGIYVHEIGHVRAMHKLGLGDSAPSFIPGVGAYVQMDHLPVSVRESARVGLAGPIWGLAFSLVVFGIYFLIDYPILGEIARVSAWINLLNLMPLPPFDGGRGFSALSRTGTFLVTILIGAMWYLTRDGLLIALFLTGMLVTTAKSPEAAVTSDRRALLELCILVVALSLLSNIKIPITPIL